MSSHGLMHMVISNAYGGTRKIDTLFMYATAYRELLHEHVGHHEDLTDKDENGTTSFRGSHSDAYSSGWWLTGPRLAGPTYWSVTTVSPSSIVDLEADRPPTHPLAGGGAGPRCAHFQTVLVH